MFDQPPLHRILVLLVVTKRQAAWSLVFGSGRTGRGIGAVFASQTSAEAAPDHASRATAEMPRSPHWLRRYFEGVTAVVPKGLMIGWPAY